MAVGSLPRRRCVKKVWESLHSHLNVGSRCRSVLLLRIFHALQVRVKVTAPWGAFSPDELQNEIRNNISDPIENDMFTMAEDDIFVGRKWELFMSACDLAHVCH